ncbi:hypothetical protein ACFLXP_03540 [Chloroflexota bacterium]
MSKFIDKLGRISRVEAQALGFRTTKATPEKTKILLIARIKESTTSELTSKLDEADAMLISALKSRGSTVKNSKITLGVPWGLDMKNTKPKKVKQSEKTGCDFVVFQAADAPDSAMEDNEIGKVLELEPSLNKELLPAVNKLPIDAVLIATDEEKKPNITWQDLMLFQRFTAVLDKPVLTHIPPQISIVELQLLWNAGIDGVVVEIATSQKQNILKKIRQLIDKLEFPRQHRLRKTEALLPHISNGINPQTEEEEE